MKGNPILSHSSLSYYISTVRQIDNKLVSYLIAVLVGTEHAHFGGLLVSVRCLCHFHYDRHTVLLSLARSQKVNPNPSKKKHARYININADYKFSKLFVSRANTKLLAENYLSQELTENLHTGSKEFDGSYSSDKLKPSSVPSTLV